MYVHVHVSLSLKLIHVLFSLPTHPIGCNLDDLVVAAQREAVAGLQTWDLGNLSGMQRVFLRFCDSLGLDVTDLHCDGLSAFVESLAIKGLILGTIFNYVSAIRLYLTLHLLPTVVFDTVEWNMTSKALTRTVPRALPRRATFTWEHLEVLVHFCLPHQSNSTI